MELLDLGKDSVYRRLKNEVAFSFEEIIKLSQSLSFSIDQIIGKSKTERILFEKFNSVPYNPLEVFTTVLRVYLDYLIKIHQAKEKEHIASVNKFFVIHSTGYQHLFKFFYYKWTHQTSEIPSNLPLSEITVAEEIISLQNKINYYYMMGDNVTFIIDPDTYLNTIREIQYYYIRGLISDTELELIKEDFHSFFNDIEKLVHTGKNKYGGRIFFYLSTLNIESSDFYTRFDDVEQSDFWIDTMEIISTNDHDMCVMNKKWLESLKKYSVLITKSNELLQASYFQQQRKYLDNISNELYRIKFY